MQNWDPGDQVFVFGFSRGAYTARALTGMLRTIGLMRPGLENPGPVRGAGAHPAVRRQVQGRVLGNRARVRECFRAQGRWQAHHRADPLSRPLGHGQGRGHPPMGDSLALHGTTLPNVKRCRHAVSIDEKRRPYKHDPVTSIARRTGPWRRPGSPACTRTWESFDDEGPRLSTIALKWVVQGAVASGLRVRGSDYDAACTVGPEHAFGGVHRMGRIWALATYKRRSVPDHAGVHGQHRGASPTRSEIRRRSLPGYGPIHRSGLGRRPRPTELTDLLAVSVRDHIRFTPSTRSARSRRPAALSPDGKPGTCARTAGRGRTVATRPATGSAARGRSPPRPTARSRAATGAESRRRPRKPGACRPG